MPLPPSVNSEISFLKHSKTKKQPYLQMAIVAENIWCLGGEREPWAPPVFSNKYADKESRMLNLKEGGEAQGLQGEVTSHPAVLETVPSPGVPSISLTMVLRILHSLSTRRMRQPCIIAEAENISLTLKLWKIKQKRGP